VVCSAEESQCGSSNPHDLCLHLDRQIIALSNAYLVGVAMMTKGMLGTRVLVSKVNVENRFLRSLEVSRNT
jgi:hypothetical protein